MTLGPAIILIIVAAIAGYVIGLVDSRITASLRKKDTPEVPPIDNLPAAAKENDDEHTVLRVTIDKAIKWHLDLDGKRIENPETMTIEQRQRMVGVVVQMRPWLEGKSVPAAPVNEISASEMPALKPVIPPPAVVQATINQTPPKLDALRGLRSLLQNDIKTVEKQKSVSIVSMIDEILQAKLMNTQLLGRGIRLEDGPMGEVIVYVDSHRYTSVDEVPDPEIRAVIKAAITDWEKK